MFVPTNERGKSQPVLIPDAKYLPGVPIDVYAVQLYIEIGKSRTDRVVEARTTARWTSRLSVDWPPAQVRPALSMQRNYMSLLDRMLSRATPQTGKGRRRVLVRVWLDDEGRVRDLKVRRSCGDPASDERALHAIAVMRFPRGQLGSGGGTSQRWHDLNYDVD
ncbi:energy transducer TonB family protein [Burkholderia vietnamiensis]|uniref:TonB family protein n=1 Tax=Burkholderia vietnamiensis TaxID=60552 RepID=A0AAW7T1B5_BURVI|nr:energy transducer TonB [Burkholderia vietnamiensis]MDN7796120.1 TonB family protein [Burkholderia vietnamiensis]